MLWGQALGLESQGLSKTPHPSQKLELLTNGLRSRTEVTSLMFVVGRGMKGILWGERKDSFPKQLFCRMESTEHKWSEKKGLQGALAGLRANSP